VGLAILFSYNFNSPFKPEQQTILLTGRAEALSPEHEKATLLLGRKTAQVTASSKALKYSKASVFNWDEAEEGEDGLEGEEGAEEGIEEASDCEELKDTEAGIAGLLVGEGEEV